MLTHVALFLAERRGCFPVAIHRDILDAARIVVTLTPTPHPTLAPSATSASGGGNSDRTAIVAALLGGSAAIVAALIGAFVALCIAVDGQRANRLAQDRQHALDTQEHDRQRNLDKQDRERTSQEQKANVRTLLSTEAEHNLDVLRQLDEVIQATDVQKSYMQRWQQMRQRLASEPLPDFSHHMWSSLAPLLSAALSGEELSRLINFYGALTHVTNMRRELDRLETAYQTDARQTESLTGTERDKRLQKLTEEHNANVAQPWLRGQKLAREIRSTGNPLQTMTQQAPEAQESSETEQQP